MHHLSWGLPHGSAVGGRDAVSSLSSLLSSCIQLLEACCTRYTHYLNHTIYHINTYTYTYVYNVCTVAPRIALDVKVKARSLAGRAPR